MISGYLHALRVALSRQADAYGFTLVVWGTGALAVWQLGKPDPADVFAYVGGALLSISLIVALVFGVWRPFRQGKPPRRAFSAMHLLSVPAAIAAGWGLSTLLRDTGGFFAAAFAAVGLYQALLSAEIAAALTAEDESGSPSRGERD